MLGIKQEALALDLVMTKPKESLIIGTERNQEDPLLQKISDV
jgi:hypothetical protein